MITVIDLECNEEFELVDLRLDEGYVVIRSDKYGYCRQKINLIKFTNNQINL